ncbi:hypothetical protein V495_01204 [Pseudogymnoascus sp. VKM F-4514 (FW-929)]|nr:hypothetical protein V495_01204 [Pseudogymnoascus sp. VKM F-4514 (FW-929)]KFY66532.1 hypothetical protein V497_00867 [Pseudogymnoascus sp. VKM F-4516 (FW-969)]
MPASASNAPVDNATADAALQHTKMVITRREPLKATDAKTVLVNFGLRDEIDQPQLRWIILSSAQTAGGIAASRAD